MKIVFFAVLSRYRTEKDFAFMLTAKYCRTGATACTSGSSPIAFASSRVNFLRLNTSGGNRPPTVGGMRWTKIKFDPRSWICDAILLFSPLRIDDIRMTVKNPATTPRTVKNERSLFLRRESGASRRNSLISQGHDRIEIGRLRRGIDPEKQADARGYDEAERHCPPFNRSRQRRQPRNCQCNGGSKQNADDATNQCKSRRLDQKDRKSVV